MPNEKIKWHPAFAAAIQLEFKEYKEYLDFIIEHQLTDEPLRIDVVIIKKLKDIEINKSIGKILRKYNVVEYKSPTDYISIDDYYKVKVYAYLYKALSKETNSIDINDITITLVSNRYPKKLLEFLKNQSGILVSKVDNGIYYIENTDIRTQIIVSKELSDEEAAYLKLLQMEHKNKSIIENWINEYVNNIKNPLYSIIMNVLAESSPNDILEVYKNMGMEKLTEENRKFLLDAMEQLGIKEKYREEGIQEGALKERVEVLKKLIKAGSDIDFIKDITGFTEEEIEKIKAKMH